MNANAQQLPQPSSSQAAPVPVTLPPTAAEAASVAPAPAASVAAPRKPSGLGPRWSYVLTRGTIVALVWAFFAYAFDPLLRYGAITAGQNVARAKVEIADLKTSFFPPRLDVTQLAVADHDKPLKNLVEFASLTGEFDRFALLKGSVVIDKAAISGLKWGTDRKESGQLDKETAIEEAESSIDWQQLEQLGKGWAKELLDRAKLQYNVENLETVRIADQLEDEWQDDFKSLEARVKDLEAKIKLVESKIKGAKKGDTATKINSYTQIAGDSAQLLRELDSVRKDLEGLPRRAKDDLQTLNEARQRDEEVIRRKIKDFALDGDHLSDFLLGPTLHLKVKQTLAWLKWANGRVDEFANPPKPERFRGEDIPFPREIPLPKFLARLIEVQGEGKIGGEPMQVQGTLADISSDPKLLKKPTVLQLKGHGESDVELHATFDRTEDEPRNDIDLKYVLHKPLSVELGDKDSLSVKVDAQETTWNAYVRTEGDRMIGRILMVQDPAKFEPRVKDNADERLVRILQTSIRGIDKVEATVQLAGTVTKPTMKFKTNLGPALARGVREAIGNEVSAQQDVLLAKLNDQFKEKNGGLVKLFNGKYGDVAQQLNLNESTIKNLAPKPTDIAVDPSKLDGIKKIFR